MSEAKLWEHLRDAVGGLWDVQRHEPSALTASADVPDVSYSTTHHGWIELKFVAEAPKRGGPVRLPHFTPGQRGWLTRHGKRGGKCFVLLQVGTVYFLFSWKSAWKLGDLTLEELSREALVIWGNGIVVSSFLDALEGVTTEGRPGAGAGT